MTLFPLRRTEFRRTHLSKSRSIVVFRWVCVMGSLWICGPASLGNQPPSVPDALSLNPPQTTNQRASNVGLSPDDTFDGLGSPPSPNYRSGPNASEERSADMADESTDRSADKSTDRSAGKSSTDASDDADREKPDNREAAAGGSPNAPSNPPLNSPSNPPSGIDAIRREAVAEELATVAADTSLSPEMSRRMTSVLQQTIDAIDAAAADLAQTAEIAKSVRDVESATEATRQTLRELESDDVITPRIYGSIEKVRALKAAAEVELSAASETVSELDSEIARRDALKQSLPIDMAATRKRIAELETELATPPPRSDPVLATRTTRAAAAELIAQRARLDLLKQREIQLNVETDLLPLKRRVAGLQQSRIKRRTEALADAVRRHRETEIVRMLNDHRFRIEQSDFAVDQSFILSRQDAWLDSVRSHAMWSRRLTEHQRRSEGLQTSATEVKNLLVADQASSGRLSTSTALRLKLIRDALPNVSMLRHGLVQLDAKIDDIGGRRDEAEWWTETRGGATTVNDLTTIGNAAIGGPATIGGDSAGVDVIGGYGVNGDAADDQRGGFRLDLSGPVTTAEIESPDPNSSPDSNPSGFSNGAADSAFTSESSGFADATINAAERALVRSYESDLRNELSTLVKVRTEVENAAVATERLRREIDGYLMWIRSTRVFLPQDLLRSAAYARALVRTDNARSIVDGIVSGSTRRPQYACVAALLMLLHFIGSPRLRSRYATLAERARHQFMSSVRPTMTALVLTVVRSVPIPVTLWMFGKMFQSAADGSSAAVSAGYTTLSEAFVVAAAAMLPFELFRQTFRQDGLAVAHFGMDANAVVPLRRHLRWVIILGTPLVLIWGLTGGGRDTPASLTLGRSVFAAGALMVMVTTWRLFAAGGGFLQSTIRHNPDGWLARTRYFWMGGLLAVPLIMAGLNLIGYVHASHQLSACLYGTFAAGWCMMIAWGLTRRMVRRAHHRLLIRKREAAAAAEAHSAMGASLGASIEDETPVLEISSQNHRVITVAFLLVAWVLASMIWSPVLPAIELLNSITLWSTETADGDLRPITLANVLMTIPVVVLVVVAVRNLPGLIESVFLERLPLANAARYAIVSLSTYVIAAVGVTYASYRLGLRWESIQWLVAALGVGLGFGLQEIFANFVSGLILLFEQPLRVGDVVTLGDTTGVVSRIRIRATTVTKWDRQELIIPNKDLITGRLVNWTLSDTTNRVMIEVGVAYGTDTDRACEILRQILDEHPSVTDDPPPLVTFEGFGDSTLNLVVRCFLTSLDVRLVTIHELHTAINRQFNQHDIEIAFPQRDLHLRTVPT